MDTEEPLSLADKSSEKSQTEKSHDQTEPTGPVHPKPPKRKPKANAAGGKMTTKESGSTFGTVVTPYSRRPLTTESAVTINNPADNPYVFNVSMDYNYF